MSFRRNKKNFSNNSKFKLGWGDGFSGRPMKSEYFSLGYINTHYYVGYEEGKRYSRKTKKPKMVMRFNGKLLGAY